jgi:Ca2+-transporting ATPase
MIYEPKTGWVEGVSIYVVLALGVLITSVNDYIKDKCFVDLQAVAKDSNLGVFRGKMGQMQTINMWDLVVGDVIQLNSGDVVPADCIIMKSDYVNVIAPNSEKGEGVHLPRGDSNPFIICDE